MKIWRVLAAVWLFLVYPTVCTWVYLRLPCSSDVTGSCGPLDYMCVVVVGAALTVTTCLLCVALALLLLWISGVE